MQITEMKAKVNTMDDIKKFVSYLNQFPNDVDVWKVDLRCVQLRS